MKHNNVVPNAHFHKHWHIPGRELIKTWLNQPARKERRRRARAAKAAKVFPRPVSGLLRPEVRCPTQRYNRRTRLGRGFTLEELKAAGFNRNEARNIGVAVDHRRRNKSEESFQLNVQRLKQYKSKLVVFPKNAKKSPEAAAAAAQVAQFTGALLPISTVPVQEAARKITEQETKTSAYSAIRKARSDARLIGVRAKRKANRAAAKPKAANAE